MKQPSIGFCTPWCHEAGVSKIWVKGFVVSWQWFGPIPSIGCWHRFSNPGESLKSHQQKLWHKWQVKNLRNVSGLALKSGRPKKKPINVMTLPKKSPARRWQWHFLADWWVTSRPTNIMVDHQDHHQSHGLGMIGAAFPLNIFWAADELAWSA